MEGSIFVFCSPLTHFSTERTNRCVSHYHFPFSPCFLRRRRELRLRRPDRVPPTLSGVEASADDETPLDALLQGSGRLHRGSRSRQ